MMLPDDAATPGLMSTSIWAAACSALGGIGSWWLAVRTMRASIERDRGKLAGETLAAENAERAKFRAALMDEVAELRTLVRACETDRVELRKQISVTEAQIQALKASNEITERWLAFFKDKHTRGLSMANDVAG